MPDTPDRNDSAPEEAARERTIFHLYFADLLLERGPKNVTVSFDLPLTREPQRADIVIMRKDPGEPPGEAHVVRRFWELTAIHTVGEYKSPARPPRLGDLVRLLAYGAQYHTRQYQTGQYPILGDRRRLASSRELSLALFVPTWTPTLDRELGVFGWTAEPLGGGYYVVRAQPYVLHVVVLAEVCRAEHDELLALHAGGTITGDEIERRLTRH